MAVLVGEARAQTVDPRRLRLGPRRVVGAAHAAGHVLARPVPVAVVGRDDVLAASLNELKRALSESNVRLKFYFINYKKLTKVTMQIAYTG